MCATMPTLGTVGIVGFGCVAVVVGVFGASLPKIPANKRQQHSYSGHYHNAPSTSVFAKARGGFLYVMIHAVNV
jgi:hypothetical protein